MTDINSTNLARLGNIEINSFNQLIANNQALQSATSTELGNITKELETRQELQINQIREIEDKEKLLLTRARMLQISQDRNAYKKKIIYTLIAIIFGIFILTLVIYVLFVRKIGMIKNK
jgi:hypothetical protein